MGKAYTKENVEGIILAAGYSSRADAFKPELDLNGRSVIERCMLSMYGFCSKIIVVGGYRVESIRRIVGKHQKAEVVDNPIYDKGMFTSVKEGFRHVCGQKIFLIPADYPLVEKETYKKMLATEGDIVIPVFSERKGHPVLFAQKMVANILSEPDTSNLRSVIKKNGYKTVEVDDEGILIDLDTPKDYMDIQEKIKKGE